MPVQYMSTGKNKGWEAVSVKIYNIVDNIFT